MNPRKLVSVGLSLCACLAVVATVDVVEAKKKETLTITGTILGAEMRGNKIVTVYLNDAEHGEFIVLRGTDVAKKLLKQVGQRIRATGYIGDATRERGFDRYIDILEYELLPEIETASDGS